MKRCQSKSVVKAALPGGDGLIVVSEPSAARRHNRFSRCMPRRRSHVLLHMGGARRVHVRVRLQVIKIGTSSLIRSDQHVLNLGSLARICETVKALHDQGATATRTSRQRQRELHPPLTHTTRILPCPHRPPCRPGV